MYNRVAKTEPCLYYVLYDSICPLIDLSRFLDPINFGKHERKRLLAVGESVHENPVTFVQANF